MNRARTLGLGLVFVAACKTTPSSSGAPHGSSTAPVAPSAALAPSAVAGAASAPTHFHKAESYPITDAARAVVDAADRSADDRALDPGRHPAEMLSFYGIQPGMKVGELVAGLGYTTELLARAVGPTGKVYAENNRFVLERFAEKGWAERLSKPINKNVVRLDRELDDPFGAGVEKLDAVFIVLFYHDTVWQNVDREKMNRAVLAALKPGGVYAVIDHSGRPGTAATETQTLHRIEELTLKEEIVAATFHLTAEAYFLRNPDDPRDWNDAPRAAADRRGTSDRFVLKFTR